MASDADSFHTSQKQNDLKKKIVGFCACTTIVGTISLMAPFVFCQIKSPLPYMATPSRKIQKALEVVIRQKMTKNRLECMHRNFLDLGSGDGEAVYQATNLGYTRAIGIEFNWTLYCLSQFRRYIFWSADERRRSSFYCQNMFHVSLDKLTESDTVMIFGVQSLMGQVSATLAKACKPGTHVIAYRFPLPIHYRANGGKHKENVCLNGEQSTQMGTKEFLDAKVIYEKDEIIVYECN